MEPILTFKKFGTNYTRLKVGNLLDFFSTNSFSRDLLDYGIGEVYNIHYGDIHTKFQTRFSFSEESVPYVKGLDSKKILQEKFCLEGDLIFVDAAEDYEGIIKLTEIIETKGKKIIAGLHTIHARPRKQLSEIGYLGYYFQSPRYVKSVWKITQGTKVYSISPNRIKDLEVFLPSLPEQQKIASFIGAVDQRIKILQKKRELLQQYKKGVMQQIFSQQIRFKQDDGTPYPAWEEKRIGEIFRITRGNVLKSSETAEIQTKTKKYPVYSSQTKNNGLMGYYSDFLFENSITWTTDGANAGDVNYRYGKFYCTNVCGVLISNEGYSNLAIAEILNSVTKRYVSYVGNPKLMNNVMASIKIFIPSNINEQKKISNFLSSIDGKIEILEKQITGTQKFKKGLLQQMFV